MMYAGRIAAGKSTVWPVAIRGLCIWDVHIQLKMRAFF